MVRIWARHTVYTRQLYIAVHTELMSVLSSL